MIYGEVPVRDLHRMTYNALLYATRQSSAKGDTLWLRGHNTLRVVSSDDYFILVDNADLADGDVPCAGIMSVANLKALERELREWPQDQFSLDRLILEPDSTNLSSYRSLMQADEMVFTVEQYSKNQSGTPVFAVAPDRLRKLSLVKPGDHPIDIRLFSDPDNGQVLAYRIGPTVQGLVALLDRDSLRQLYSGEELWS